MFGAELANNPELLQEITETEQSVQQYSHEALAHSVVNTRILDCRYPFLNMPPLSVWNAEDMKPQPKYISSVDMSIDYNRKRNLFNPKIAYLNMDNGFSFMLRRLDSLPDDPHEDSPPYLGLPLTPTKLPAISSSDWMVFRPSAAIELLRRVGVTVPQHEQPASWDEIRGILQFAGEWKAKSRNSVMLDDLRRAVHIQEKVVGGTSDSDHDDLTDDSLRYREVRLSVDESPMAGELPTVAWQLLNRSPSLTETPCIQALRRLPITHTMSDCMTLETGDTWSGQAVRIELEDQATSVPLDSVVLQAVRGVLDEARLARV